MIRMKAVKPYLHSGLSHGWRMGWRQRLCQLLCLSSFSSATQIPLRPRTGSPFDAKFDDHVNSLLQRWHAPGLAIAVIDGDQTFSKGYGLEKLPDTPVTPSTLFYTASTTKSFTAAALSLLIDDNINSSRPLTWQTPIGEYLREDFVMQDSYLTDHITIEDAASHRSGQPAHDFAWAFTTDTVVEAVRKFRHLPSTAPIRSEWQYNNLMFVTLSHLIEKVTGSWLGDFLRSRIYEPLNMTTTFFSLPHAKTAVSAGSTSLAQGYVWNNTTESYIAVPWTDSPAVSGAGATISNVLDYAKWLRCLMTRASPLSSPGHAALRKPRITLPILHGEGTGLAEFDFYSLGLIASFYRGEPMFWHTGGLPGFGTFMAFLPNRQLGVVSMSNTVEGGSRVNQILAFKLIDNLLGISKADRYDWSSIFEKAIAESSYKLSNARAMLYPKAPENPLPHALPLQEYTGLYTHPAYPPLTLTVKTDRQTRLDSVFTGEDSYLQTDSFHRLDGDHFIFQHVSGEYFLVYIRQHTGEAHQRGANDPWDAWLDDVIKAEFKLGEDGKVKEVGIAIVPEMGEEKIWWTKA